MHDFTIKISVNDWRDVGFDSDGNRLSEEENAKQRKAILADLANRAVIEIETRAEEKHDIVVKAERDDED